MRRKSDEELLAQLKTLYPTLSPEELLLAKENLERYLLLAWEIYEELERNPRATLTPSFPSSSIQAKVDSKPN